MHGLAHELRRRHNLGGALGDLMARGARSSGDGTDAAIETGVWYYHHARRLGKGRFRCWLFVVPAEEAQLWP
jgi:hypothetical protein